MAVLFTIAPSGASVPRMKQTVLVSPAAAGRSRRQDDGIGIDAIPIAQDLAAPHTALALCPPVQHLIEREPRAGGNARVEQAKRAQVQQHLRNATREVHAHGRMRSRGQRVDQSRNGAVDGHPVLDARAAQAGRVRDGRHVQQEVRRTAERRMRHHRVANRRIGDQRPCRPAERALRLQPVHRAGGTIEPDRLT